MTYKYFSFISYSHQDKIWGDWLHHALETYKVPKALIGTPGRDGPIAKRVYPVFRDREELPTAIDLGDQINQALEDSAYLVVICSPRSAKSLWVNEEIKAFKRLGKEDRILAIIVDGEPNGRDKPGYEDQECFPEALKYKIGDDGELTSERTEPIAADARPDKDGKSNAKLKLLAGLLGVKFDALKQRERSRKRKQLITYVFIGVFLSACLVIGVKVNLDSHKERLVQETLKVAQEAQTRMNEITYDQRRDMLQYELDSPVEIVASLLDVLPSHIRNPARPVTRDAEIALMRAVSLNDVEFEDKTIFVPENWQDRKKTDRVPFAHKIGFEDSIVSADAEGNILLVLTNNDLSYTAHIYGLADGKKLSSFSVETNTKSIMKAMLSHDGKTAWIYEDQNPGQKESESSIRFWKKTDGNQFYLFDTQTGQEISKLQDVNVPVMRDDKKTALLSTKSGELIRLDLKDGTEKMLWDGITHRPVNYIFLGEDIFFAAFDKSDTVIKTEYGTEISATLMSIFKISGSKGDPASLGEWDGSWTQLVVSPEQGRLFFQVYSYAADSKLAFYHSDTQRIVDLDRTENGIAQMTPLAFSGSGDELYASFFEEILVLDPESGDIIERFDYPGTFIKSDRTYMDDQGRFLFTNNNEITPYSTEHSEPLYPTKKKCHTLLSYGPFDTDNRIKKFVTVNSSSQIYIYDLESCDVVQQIFVGWEYLGNRDYKDFVFAGPERLIGMTASEIHVFEVIDDFQESFERAKKIVANGAQESQ